MCLNVIMSDSQTICHTWRFTSAKGLTEYCSFLKLPSKKKMSTKYKIHFEEVTKMVKVIISHLLQEHTLFCLFRQIAKSNVLLFPVLSDTSSSCM